MEREVVRARRVAKAGRRGTPEREGREVEHGEFQGYRVDAEEDNGCGGDTVGRVQHRFQTDPTHLPHA